MRRLSVITLLIGSCLISLTACGVKAPPQAVLVQPADDLPPHVEPVSAVDSPGQIGTASYYGPRFHGRKTASGERFDMYDMTAAHRFLPLGTVVQVENLANNRVLTVKINDRGPYITGRILDLSYGAAKQLGFVTAGTTQVRITPVEPVASNHHFVLGPPTPNFDLLSIYSIVAAAFDRPERALRLEDQLSKRFSDVRVKEPAGDSENLTWQVLVGRYKSEEEMTPDLKRLKQLGLKRRAHR